MSKGTFLVIAACFLILSILSFVGGFVVSKAIHDSKPTPVIIQHHPSEKTLVHAVEDKVQALVQLPKNSSAERPHLPAKSSHPQSSPPSKAAALPSSQPVPLPELPAWQAPLPSDPVPYPLPGVTVGDADPYSALEQIKEEHTLHNITQWRQQPYKNLEDNAFPIPSFATDKRAADSSPPLDPALHEALARV